MGSHPALANRPCNFLFPARHTTNPFTIFEPLHQQIIEFCVVQLGTSCDGFWTHEIAKGFVGHVYQREFFFNRVHVSTFLHEIKHGAKKKLSRVS